MRRFSFVISCLRWIFAGALVFFLFMQIWSSRLIESQMKEIKVTINDLNTKVKTLGTVRDLPQKKGSGIGHPLEDPSRPNLFNEDFFYTTSLPKILGEDFVPRGRYRTAYNGRALNFHPMTKMAPATDIFALCQTRLGKNAVGTYGELTSAAAYKMEERESKETGDIEYWFFLRDDVYWAPISNTLFGQKNPLDEHFNKSHPVTAHDYQFYFDAIMNPFVTGMRALQLRSVYQDIRSVEAVDDRLLVVRWKTQNGQVRFFAPISSASLLPLPGFVFKYFQNGEKILSDDDDPLAYQKSSLWAQNFNDHWAQNIIVSCGPFTFSGADEKGVLLKRNPDYFNPLAALVKEREILFFENPQGPWQSFQKGDIETFLLGSNELDQWESFLESPLYRKQKERGQGAETLSFLEDSYSYIAWNQKNPLFTSNKVRRALTLAIDRQRIIERILGGRAVQTSGPFISGSQRYDESVKPLPYDPEQALILLEQEGWADLKGDGRLYKEVEGDLIPFTFTLTYLFRNPQRKAIAEFVASSLKKIGIHCQPHGVDRPEYSESSTSKSFDAFIGSWRGFPPSFSPRALWHSELADKVGSSNLVGFSNEEVDRLIEELEFEGDTEARNTLFKKIHYVIHEEAPYTFLYTPKLTLAYRESVKNVLIPTDHPDIFPGADVTEPIESTFWLDETEEISDLTESIEEEVV